MIYHIGFGDRLNFPEKWGDERFDVWTIAIPQSNFTDKKIHPFQKPIALLERIVGIGSNEGDLVLDPFSGSGTTALACKKLNRNFIGSELNKEHYENSLERLNLNGFEKTEVGGLFLLNFSCTKVQSKNVSPIAGNY